MNDPNVSNLPAHYQPKRIDIPQRTEEWRQFRLGKIGASQISAVLNLNFFRSKRSAWNEIFLGRTQPVSPAMERGIKYEAEALEYFSRVLGRKFEPAVFQHGIKEKYIASLDGWDGTVSIEIKIPTVYKKNGVVIPDMYFPQMQQQIAVMGTEYCFYGEYCPELKEGFVITQERDQDFIDDMFKLGDAFLESGLNCDPPEYEETERVEIVDPRAKEVANRYKEIQDQLRALQEESDWVRHELIELVGNDYCSVDDLKIQKVCRKGNVDYGKIPELKGVDLDKYRKKTIESWRIF